VTLAGFGAFLPTLALIRLKSAFFALPLFPLVSGVMAEQNRISQVTLGALTDFDSFHDNGKNEWCISVVMQKIANVKCGILIGVIMTWEYRL
jgi:hypothetical protein